MPTTGSPGLCTTPSPTGATAGGTRHRRSPSPRTSDDGGNGRAPPAQATGPGGGDRGQCRGTPPLAEAAPPTHPPPTVQCGREARATSSGREDGGTAHERKPTAP